MPIENVPSVLEHGILSFERTTKLPHTTVAMADIQDRRDKKIVPGGLALHRYANLYFDARNPMMFKRRGQATNLCVLTISAEVMKLDGVVLTDQNAASDYVRFLSLAQIDIIDFDMVFARDWRHRDDPITYWRHKSAKCAEVLVPHSVPPEYLTGAYICNESVRNTLVSKGFNRPVHVNADIFFL
jgi:hypothetical protein